MFDCVQCSRRFSRRHNLFRHLRLIHRICQFCLEKFGDENTHNCQLGVKTKQLSPTQGQEEAPFPDPDKPNDHQEEEEEEEDDDEESEAESEENMEQCSDTNNEEDIFSIEDEEQESDVTISDSEEEEEGEEEEEELGVEEEEVSDENMDDDKNSIALEWPNHKYYLVSLWQKYGEGEFKLIEHQSWLEDFTGKSDPKIQRMIRKASDSQFEAFSEIAQNILAGNVYPLMLCKTFLLKNRGLIRALANPNISLERKKEHVIERGAHFVCTLIQIIQPLIETLPSIE